MTSTVIVPLNADFRIIVTADAQFLLEKFDDFDGLWRERTRCRSRDALEKVIRLYVDGPVDALALAALDLPDQNSAPKKRRSKKRGAA